MRDPVEIVTVTILHAAEALAVVLFIGMLAVWAALGSGA